MQYKIAHHLDIYTLHYIIEPTRRKVNKTLKVPQYNFERKIVSLHLLIFITFAERKKYEPEIIIHTPLY